VIGGFRGFRGFRGFKGFKGFIGSMVQWFNGEVVY
jgi:hypothetical protein